MPKFKYVGKEKEHLLAQVGKLTPGQEFTVSEKIAEQLEKHAPESYRKVPDKKGEVVAGFQSGQPPQTDPGPEVEA